MGRAQFKADVAAAIQQATAGAIDGVTSIEIDPDSDNTIIITSKHESMPDAARIHATAQDPSEYPEGNTYLVYADDGAPQAVLDAIETAQHFLFGIRLDKMVSELSKSLQKTFSPVSENTKSDNGEDSDSNDEEEEDYDDETYDDDAFGLSTRDDVFSSTAITTRMAPIRRRIKHDFRLVRQAGYRVGFVDGLTGAVDLGIVSVSIRVSKLGLSDDVMEAWGVELDDYFVLLLRYTSYAALEDVISMPAVYSPVRFRVGKCKSYKPSVEQALAAFSENKRKTDGALSGPGIQTNGPRDETKEFHRLLISNSLNENMNETFASLLKIREAHRCTWDQAYDVLKATVATGSTNTAEATLDLMEVDSEHEGHQILASDHLKEVTSERSFPLVAMQFAIRSFMKCTDYCMRCHQKLGGFKALRPYVCDNPLCLFQYVSMGFGPNIEHEIVTEPYVVDLLVSLCYAAIHLPIPVHNAGFNSKASSNTSGAGGYRIRSFPVGLELMVPNLKQGGERLKARKRGPMFCFDVENETSPVFDACFAIGKWVAFRSTGHLIYHGVITDADRVAKSIVVEPKASSSVTWGAVVPSAYNTALPQEAMAEATTPSEVPDGVVEIFPYDTDFDGMSDADKALSMRHILDTLPSILTIDKYLSQNPRNSVLSMDTVSPAAFRLLQWIVSTNRSCIYQVDRARPTGETSTLGTDPQASATVSTGKAGRGRDRESERIGGMNGWVQFRFAQGAPDKELKFNRELEKMANSGTIDIKTPTIFAWHGSALANWHSIVRTGLDYKDILCGRAFGNGVYFSAFHSTSVHYSGQAAAAWPNSDLSFSACMSLNEIVGAPQHFVSQSPHYVVAQKDWHQCRYLFVSSKTIPQSKSAPTKSAVVKKSLLGQLKQNLQDDNEQKYHSQLPKYKVMGPDGKELNIPLSAIPVRNLEKEHGSTVGKRAIALVEDPDSEVDDQEDAEFLSSEDGFESSEPPLKKRDSKSPIFAPESEMARGRPPTPPEADVELTDFMPGHLDLFKLPRLEAPSFANPMATKALSREIKRLQKTQSATPLHELKWYIDFEQVTNLFQWIVEFHSFDPSLPLAKDMKSQGVTSIVFEFRFGRDYPMSPPFVRVIRPRFLPFMQGGGGHVTIGGAMCMELLTASGWSPANSMESVLLQVQLALCSLDPKPARLVSGPSGDYGVGEAIEAFIRAARTHNWAVPEDLKQTAEGV